MTEEDKSIINITMITELKEKDIPQLLSSLSKDRYRNLFFINNLKTLTMGKEYKAYKVGDAYLMNFMDSSILIWSEGDYDSALVSQFLESQKFMGINGPAECLIPVMDYIKGKGFTADIRKMLYVDKQLFKKVSPRDEKLKYLMAPEDFEDLYDLYYRCPEYKDGVEDKDREEFGLDMAEKEYPFAAAGYYVGRIMVSGAYLSAYTRESAMVVSVATDPDYRNMGYATKTVSELVDIALNENNIGYLCLWYSTPDARRVYDKLGFKEIGSYAYFHR